MNFFDLFRYFLILIVPGVFGAILYSYITHCKLKFMNALAFDLMAFISMILGIFWFYRDVKTVTALIVAFDCLKFTAKYAIFTILIVLILAAIFGCIKKFCFWWKKCIE